MVGVDVDGEMGDLVVVGDVEGAVRGSLEQNAIYHIVVQATPRLRAALCAKGLCDANGVPVELPKIEAFRQPAQP